MDNLITIANQFANQEKIATIQAFGNGNINDTFLVTLDNTKSNRFVLQRINTQVFRQPKQVMQNMRTLTNHVHNRLKTTTIARRWEIPRVILTQEHQDHWYCVNGFCWRSLSFIEGSQSFDTLHNKNHGEEVGYALGMFHNLMSDLPPESLYDTLEGFHITPLYLQQYQKILAELGNKKQTIAEKSEVNYCLKFISDRQDWAQVLENAKIQGKLPLRLMHGDPKINNVMFDITTGKAVSVIDLDTVKPGLIHYDIGDCLRSGCNPAGEETEVWERVYFDLELCQGILQGYLAVAQSFLTENDYNYLYDAIRLLAFELGLRFFSDYLAGNIYFKVKHPKHNLARALVQFKLTESIESQERIIRQIIRDIMA